jgi:hypothetical protein
MITENYCVYDIETEVVGEKPNPEVDILKYIGFKAKGKYCIYHHSQHDEIQKVMNWFQYWVSHNGKLYDTPILNRYGLYFDRSSVQVDTFQISENRLKAMLYIDLNQGDRSLKKLAERFDLPFKKGEFDYSLLKKDKLEGDEYKLLEEYLHGDLDCCDELFKFYYKFFYGFREYMGAEDQRRMCWLINRPGSTAYKCICNLAGLPEEYEDVDDGEDEDKYAGGYVSDPYCDYMEG